ncbi:hypothetical protein [Endozoicomonas arenosclerae]|uniref:hypothetical protein n=1 Tax=Endozoicomonas arenosclerae TaxID=1633495 RepID=UPI0007850AE0|nr:hypothetical protein [Endozoicomonas arenosclerae]
MSIYNYFDISFRFFYGDTVPNFSTRDLDGNWLSREGEDFTLEYTTENVAGDLNEEIASLLQNEILSKLQSITGFEMAVLDIAIYSDSPCPSIRMTQETLALLEKVENICLDFSFYPCSDL